MGFRVPNTSGRVKQSHFAQVPSHLAAPRSAFDRSFSHKTTFNEGLLIPFLWEPILPGDTVNLSTAALCRLATPIFPYMDNLYLDIHYFFVPNRLVWSNWEKFQGAQDNPGDSVAYTVPQLSAATWAAGFGEGSLADYLGLPTKIASMVQADMPIALPFRAYNKIWNDWYRDENLQNSVTVALGDSADTTAYTVLARNRRKDYFTSSLPSPQKGPAVTLPLGTSAPVLYSNPSKVDTQLRVQATQALTGVVSGLQSTVAGGLSNAGPTGLNLDLNGTHYTDLSSATANTINSLRQAIVLQQMLELDARGGTRYVEILLARFGVVSPDFRLQRSEYLGGQTIDINVNPVAQTAITGTTPQGNLAAFAVGRGKARVNHSFVEHGQLFGIMSVRADTQYQQGMSRHFSVQTRQDYYEPMAANLGEQAVLNKEIYAAASTSQNNAVFGYQERWAEYRYKPSYVTGLFRSNAAAPLDTWHLAPNFGSLPTPTSILQEAPPVARIVAVPSQPHFLCDTYTAFKHVRILPVYSAPGLMRL